MLYKLLLVLMHFEFLYHFFFIFRMDPFVITPPERARFESQFNALQPINGIVTGDQAKGFFMQSQLPLPILGAIW